jgi:hypothetical protein
VSKINEFTDEDERAAIAKLFVVIDLLNCICSASSSVSKLKHHSVHGYNEFLFSLACGSSISRGELKILIHEAHDLNKDFIKSRNLWVKERTQLVVDLIQEIIDGNFDVNSKVFALIDEKYLVKEKIKEQITIKKFHHQVVKETKCPTCSYAFQALEIIEFLEFGYRCPKCRQAIRM